MQSTALPTGPPDTLLHISHAPHPLCLQVPPACAAAGPIDATIGDQEIDTNLRSVIVSTATMLPHLKAQPSAYLINVSSGPTFPCRCVASAIGRPIRPRLADGESVPRCLPEAATTCLAGNKGLLSATVRHLTPPAASAAWKPSEAPKLMFGLIGAAGLSFVPRAATPVYCATKAAVRSFTVSLRYQLRSGSVRVIEIIPPAVQSDLHAFLGPEGKHVR